MGYKQRNPRKAKKGRAQNKKAKGKAKKGVSSCEMLPIYRELNRRFLAPKRNMQYDLRGLVGAETFVKLAVVPAGFLEFWEGRSKQGQMDYAELAEKFWLMTERLRPRKREGFRDMTVLDYKRFEVKGWLIIVGVIFRFGEWKKELINGLFSPIISNIAINNL